MRIYISFIFLLLFTLSRAQIVDDSTELVYGPETTKIIFEGDIKNNYPVERHPDTTLLYLESYTRLDQLQHVYQDLGNNGTAMYPIFYPVPETIGLTSGFYAFDPYMISPDQVKYYNTKSPFMNLYIVFGGNGRSTVDFTFSQNINENWNIGFDIHRITSDKQIGYSGRGDRNVEGTLLDIFTHYKHSKVPYSLMFNVVSMNFDVEETGGILVETDAPDAELFQYQDANIRLEEARGSDERVNMHLYHQYALKPQLQVYHQLDIRSQHNTYRDFVSASAGAEYDPYRDFYDRFLIDADSTYENAVFREITNEAGIKGDLANLFYRVYVKSRQLKAGYLYYDPLGSEREIFLGGYTRFTWKDKFNVEANGELLQSGEYRLQGKLNSDLIFGSYLSSRYKPSLLTQDYFSNHYEWHNDFEPTFTNEIKGGIRVKLRNLLLKPTVLLLTLEQFIYYDQDITPRQSSGVLLASLGGDVNLTLLTDRERKEGFHLDNQVYFSQVTGNNADKLRVPQVFYNGRLYWDGWWFNNYMPVQVGLDIHAKTSYYALGYAPAIQQFYLQDDFQIEGFWTADFFINMQVNNFRAFFKVTNVTQPRDGGYFVTPYYPGEFRRMDFGVRWLFFD